MPINLTSVLRNINTIKTGLFYQDRPSLYCMNLSELLLEIPNGFYISKNQTQNSSGETWRCSIAENEDVLGSLDDVIPLTTTIVFQNEQFKIVSYERPRAATQVWDLILQSTGEYSNISD
jgi:hypothetical protein